MDQVDALFVKLASLEEAQDKIKKLLLEKTIALLEDPSLYNDRYVLWENTTSEIDQTVLALSPVKNVSMMSYRGGGGHPRLHSSRLHVLQVGWGLDGLNRNWLT